MSKIKFNLISIQLLFISYNCNFYDKKQLFDCLCCKKCKKSKNNQQNNIKTLNIRSLRNTSNTSSNTKSDTGTFSSRSNEHNTPVSLNRQIESKRESITVIELEENKVIKHINTTKPIPIFNKENKRSSIAIIHDYNYTPKQILFPDNENTTEE
ncbi:MAG: hypothetical protein GY830_10335 [Bacteroidetes bacterium]|nr:hypothetical protein [Bacteroidota bacterium]